MRKLPALPVVVLVAAAAYVLLLWRLRRRGALTLLRALVAAAVCVYAAGVVANTVLPIYVGGDRAGAMPWTASINLRLLAGTEPSDMLRNVAVFAPLGVLLPLVTRVRSVLGVVLVAFVLSLTMESVQLVNTVTGHGGHVADVNDLLANTLGAPLGYAAYRFALLVPPLRRLADAGRWPAPRAV